VLRSYNLEDSLKLVWIGMLIVPTFMGMFVSTTRWLNDLSWELSQVPIKHEMWEIFIHMDENCY
jgi:thiamine kinase-like enzyme